MELDVRLRSTRDQPSQGIQRHLDEAVQRQLMQLVERGVHQSGEQAFNPQIAAYQPPIRLPTVE